MRNGRLVHKFHTQRGVRTVTADLIRTHGGEALRSSMLNTERCYSEDSAMQP